MSREDLQPPFFTGDPRINRKGRPTIRQGEIHYSDMLRRFLKMPPSRLRKFIGDPATLPDRKDRATLEYMAAIQCQRAIAAKDPRHLENLLDRIYGKPKQSTELTGPDGAPLLGGDARPTLRLEVVAMRGEALPAPQPPDALQGQPAPAPGTPATPAQLTEGTPADATPPRAG